MSDQVMRDMARKIAALEKEVRWMRGERASKKSLQILKNGWVDISGMFPEYVSATSFRLLGNHTEYIVGGDKARITQTTAPAIRYFYVMSVAFSAPYTTITVNGGSDYTIANEAILGAVISHEASPAWFPHWFNWSAGLSGFSSLPSVVLYRFRIISRSVRIFVRQAGTSTSNATTFAMTAPFTNGSLANMRTFGMLTAPVDNGVILTTPGWVVMDTGTNVINLYKAGNYGAWTASGLKLASFSFEYEWR